MAVTKVYGETPQAIRFECYGYGCVAYDPTSPESLAKARAALAEARARWAKLLEGLVHLNKVIR